MHLFRYTLNSLPSPLVPYPCVASIGNFDGVHLGHQQIVIKLLQIAKSLSLPTIIILFEPQPTEYLYPNTHHVRLTKITEKISLLKKFGIDYILCLRFEKNLAKVSAQDFIQKVLLDSLHIKGLVIGDDFCFGHNKEGQNLLLQQYGKKYDFSVNILPSYKINATRVSSSSIRKALEIADFKYASQMLGRIYHITGRVIHGNKQGRQLGFPTANIALNKTNLFFNGVYIVRINEIYPQKTFYGIANIGIRPTIEEKKRLLEVYIFDFNEDIYQKKITVEFLHKLRNEKKFPNLKELQEQIKLDILNAKYFLENCKAVKIF